MTANTGIQIDDKAQLLVGMGGKSGHFTFLATFLGPLPTGDLIGGCAG